MAANIHTFKAMTSTQASYLNEISQALNLAVDAMDPAPRPQVAAESLTGHKNTLPIRPIVEFPDLGQVKQIQFQHSSKEYCLLESSQNSVRLSFAFKQQFSDHAIDQAILAKYVRFIQQRATNYGIIRRKTIGTGSFCQEAHSKFSRETTSDGTEWSLLPYSISFLVTNEHIEQYGRHQIIGAILNFVRHLDKECSEIKIAINARARSVAADFLRGF